jgi:hypothetical protein
MPHRMILRSLLVAAALLCAAPAIAQATPQATLDRFVQLANAGELTTPAGQALLTGEALQMATSAKSTLPVPDRVVLIGADKAAARFVLRGPNKEEADAYFYLQKSPKGWAVSAYRAMAATGISVMLLNELKKRKSLTEEEAIEKRNLELTLSTDSQLRAWFTDNRTALENLAARWSALPTPRQPATARDASGIGPTLPPLGLTAVDEEDGAVRIVIGGMSDNTVGFLRAGPSGPPKMSPSGYIWVEDLGTGWFLFRTT